VRGTTLRRRGAVAFGELPKLAAPARRTTALRLVLGLALAGTLALAVLSGRSAGSGRAAVLPKGAGTGVVVLDMSASISGAVYARVENVLRGIEQANQAIGLVMFSDVAYELLPPNSPPGALLQFLRFFVPQRIVGGTPLFQQTPWDQFSGGTRISSGLREGARALRRAGVEHGAILLVSDLDDSAADQEPLVAESLALKRQHIPVRVVPLFAAAENRAIFSALFGRDVFVTPSAFSRRAGRTMQPVAADPPWRLLGLGALLVLLLAANERLNRRLELGATT
jgi:hypothetical protein